MTLLQVTELVRREKIFIQKQPTRTTKRGESRGLEDRDEVDSAWNAGRKRFEGNDVEEDVIVKNSSCEKPKGNLFPWSMRGKLRGDEKCKKNQVSGVQGGLKRGIARDSFVASVNQNPNRVAPSVRAGGGIDEG